MRRGRKGRVTPTALALALALLGLLATALAGCGTTQLLHHPQSTRTSPTSAPTSAPAAPSTPAASPAPLAGAGTDPSETSTPSQLGLPYLATKNTTRVAGDDPVSNAAAVALAVFPSTAAGTHPGAVVLAPSDSWQAALAASSLMGAPFRAPTLLSGPGTLPTATASALDLLAPTGDASLAGAKVVSVGDVPSPRELKSTHITGASPYATAAAIDRYEAARRGHESRDVVIVSAAAPADAMPAAGWAAESGEPILFVNAHGVPAPTLRVLKAHPHLHMYVLGAPDVIPDAVTTQLAHLGRVRRISGPTAAAESVTFAEYRDPGCPTNGQQCAHIPGSFGWAIRSPGHGYVLINEDQPLNASAAAALSASGGFGPQLLVATANTLPQAVLNYFLNYATPGYNTEGPTAAVYNHAWLIGNASQISTSVQAQVDSILEVVPAK